MTREEIEKNRQYQLTGAAIDYCRKEHPHYEGEILGEITDAFEAGAEWEHKRLVDKTCGWMKQNMYVEYIFEHNEDEKPVQYVCASACDSVDEFVNNFRKAIEE